MGKVHLLDECLPLFMQKSCQVEGGKGGLSLLDGLLKGQRNPWEFKHEFLKVIKGIAKVRELYNDKRY